MRDGVLLSGVLHIFVLLLVLIGIPWFWEPEDEHISAISVGVISEDQLAAPKIAPEDRVELPKEQPKPEIPPAPEPPELVEPVVEPEPEPEPVVPPDAPVAEEVPQEVPNPEVQESANPQEEDKPDPVIVEEPKEEPPPEPVPVPTEQVAEVQDVPVPPQKPEPPKKKEVKKKDEKKETNKATSFDKLLEDAMKDEPQQTANAPQQEQDVPVDQPATEAYVQLSASELDAIRQQFKKCWDIDPGSPDIQNMRVEIEAEYNPDATVRSANFVNPSEVRSRGSVYQNFAERALRAVRNPTCNPVRFPASRSYEEWRRVVYVFDPSEMF